MDAVRYSILGTVRVLRGETELEVGPPKRLALLSLLLLRAPGPMTLSEAVDVLWAEEPPPSAVNVVHRHIGALRRVLEPELPSRTKAKHLIRATDGYRLLVDTSTSDLLRFRGLRTQAQLALREGESQRAARLFTQALEQWRDPVVAAGTPVARHPLFTSVGHEFVATVKEAADVALTAAPDLVEEILTGLRRAVDSHPFDEALHSRIIAALAATGRQAEALRQFEAIRDVLAEELGVEPGPGLRAAQQHLLQHQVSRAPGAGPAPADRSAPGPQAGVPARPAQLPADLPVFVGRHTALDRCAELLPSEGAHRPSTVMVVCGMPGAGKTTLAVHFAHQVADRFPDGQIHLDLQGHHPVCRPLDPLQAMRDILDALGVGRRHTRTSGAALTALYRGTLAARRLLVVLDDARDSEQVRPLLPAGPDSLTLVTSRRRLEGLAVTHDARVLGLRPMTRGESLQLLDLRIGTDRTLAEPEAVRDMADRCAGLPLALTLTAARAQTNPTFSLTALAAQLREDSDSLAPFISHDPRTDLRRSFERSYRKLSRDAAALFRLLTQHPAPDIGLAAAASLGGTDPRTVRRLLTELSDHSLLTETLPGRYVCHPLLRTYATELTDTDDTPATRAEAFTRVFEHYVHTADAAAELLAPHRDPKAATLPPPRPDVRPQLFTERTEAAAWIAAERPGLQALARTARHDPCTEPSRGRLTAVLELSLHLAGR
ncbi:AfsR/SARP family transcriptional regulator [Streptomyces sp. Tu 6176]|uniref:AfsR/SARP family transcriptional regulator n=1 Tax=Streptomyces sp. Tu 6176 TaxID=1470557 RepID=UPI00055ECADD|nr:BTAD domain-containing putative transcriptional regulator [Streptomyces sp. Tu 6176]